MITVTRFNHAPLVVNAELIEFVEALPDTHITMVTGKKLLVRETTDEVVALVLEYRNAIGSGIGRPVPHEALAHQEAA